MVQSTVGGFPALCFLQFSVAQVLVGLRKQFINNFVFPSRACAAGLNNNNIWVLPRCYYQGIWLLSWYMGATKALPRYMATTKVYGYYRGTTKVCEYCQGTTKVYGYYQGTSYTKVYGYYQGTSYTKVYGYYQGTSYTKVYAIMHAWALLLQMYRVVRQRIYIHTSS